MTKETLEAMAKFISDLSGWGFAILVTGYFLYRDFKFTERQTKASEDLAANLAVLNDNREVK